MVTEILPGRLYSVSEAAEADGRISWLPDSAAGWLPIHSYVLRDEDTAIVIDTGVTAHARQIRAGLEELLEGRTTRAIGLTRYEHDAAVNLPWIVSDLAIDTVYNGGDLNPLDFFDAFDEANAVAQVDAMTGVQVAFVPRGSTTQAGTFTLSFLSTQLRVLTTQWIYEATTRTLFISDAWGGTTVPEPGARPVLAGTEAEDAEQLSELGIQEYLATKFDWIRGCDPTGILQRLKELLAELEIDRVCPTSGCVVEGPQAVAVVFERTLAAIEALAAEPFVDPLGDWYQTAAERIEQ